MRFALSSSEYPAMRKKKITPEDHVTINQMSTLQETTIYFLVLQVPEKQLSVVL